MNLEPGDLISIDVNCQEAERALASAPMAAALGALIWLDRDGWHFDEAHGNRLLFERPRECVDAVHRMAEADGWPAEGTYVTAELESARAKIFVPCAICELRCWSEFRIPYVGMPAEGMARFVWRNILKDLTKHRETCK